MGDYEEGYERGRDGKGDGVRPHERIIPGFEYTYDEKERQRGFEEGQRDRARDEYDKKQSGE